MVRPSYLFGTFFNSSERWTIGGAHEDDVAEVREVKAENSRMHSMKMEIF